MENPQAESFRDWLLRAADALEIGLEPMQIVLLHEHWRLVMQANEDFNLTRLTDPAEAAVKLVADSLAAVAWAARRAEGSILSPRSSAPDQAVVGSGRAVTPLSPQSSVLSPGPLRVLDMGTGAGYPSLPLAIARPDWTVTAIDSSGKKLRFVAQTAATLGLGNVLCEHIQAREWHGKTQPFDLVVTRALGSLASVVREGARFLAPGGCLVSYHAVDRSPEEAKSAGQMLKRYKLQEIDAFDYTLPAPDGATIRRLIVMGRPSGA